MKDSPIQQKQTADSQFEQSSAEVEGASLSPPAFQLMASTVDDTPPENPDGNPNGLPADLLNGFQASSGHDLSDVNVHRNSSKPQDVGAHAYAQGNDIHLGAGQEKHLAHEAAHIVQQREGRVKPTKNVNGLPVNDSESLENDADAMGAKALQMKASPSQLQPSAKTPPSGKTAQLQNAPAQLWGETRMIPIEVLAPESFEGGSLDSRTFGALLQESIKTDLPAHFTRGPQLLTLWPAVANILYDGIDGSNTYAVTDATSAFNPSSYTSIDEGSRAVLEKFYQARWNCNNARTRRRLISEGKRAATRNLSAGLIRYYFEEAQRDEIRSNYNRLIDDRLRAILSDSFFTIDAEGQLGAYVAPPRPPRRPRVPTDPREIEMGTLAESIAETRIAGFDADSAEAPATETAAASPATAVAATPTVDTPSTEEASESAASENTLMPGYRRINAANMAAESGGVYPRSRIGTSAGRPASLGRSQLLVELQVVRCQHYLEGKNGSGGRIAEEERPHFQRAVEILREADIDSAKLDDMDRRGKLMASLYSVVTLGDTGRGGSDGNRRRRTELSTSMRRVEAAGMDAESIRSAGLARDTTRLTAERPGSRTVEEALDLERAGGEGASIDSSDLVAMSDYNSIRRGHHEFRAIMAEYKRAHRGVRTRAATMTLIGADDNPRFADVRALLVAKTQLTIHNMTLDAHKAAVREFFRTLPSIRPLVARLEGAHATDSDTNRMEESDIDRHMSRGLRGEDRNGWYARGAMNSPFWPEFEAILPALDLFTTEERHLNNFGAAFAAASTFTGWSTLNRASQEVMLGQMSRINHGSTANFRTWFSGESPTVTTVAGYRTHIASLYTESGGVAQARGRGVFSWTRHYVEQQGINPVDPSVEIFLPTAARERLERTIARRRR